jgi:hypothetical protein
LREWNDQSISTTGLSLRSDRRVNTFHPLSVAFFRRLHFVPLHLRSQLVRPLSKHPDGDKAHHLSCPVRISRYEQANAVTRKGKLTKPKYES